MSCGRSPCARHARDPRPESTRSPTSGRLRTTRSPGTAACWRCSACGRRGPIATGHRYAALLDPASVTSRHAVVLNGKSADEGSGVRYEAQYTLLPDGPRGRRRLIIEDVGRWFAGENGQPARARGVVRIINDRYEREQRLAFLSRYDELTGYLNHTYLLSALGEAICSRATPAHAARLHGHRDRQFSRAQRYLRFRGGGPDVRDGRAPHQVDAEGRRFDRALLRHQARRNRTQLRGRRHASRRRSLPLGGARRGDRDAGRFGGGVGVDRWRGVTAPWPDGGRGGCAGAGSARARYRPRPRPVRRLSALGGTRRARRRNASLSTDLVEAFNQRRFVLGLQPIVKRRSAAVAFHEALLRMQAPKQSDVAGGRFRGAVGESWASSG